MKAYKSFFVVLILLAGCASTPAPKSVGQSIYLAQSTEIGLMQGLDNAVLAGSVTKDQAQKAQGMLQQIDAALTAARTANLSGDMVTAQDKLQAANTAILALQQYLTAQGVKSK